MPRMRSPQRMVEVDRQLSSTIFFLIFIFYFFYFFLYIFYYLFTITLDLSERKKTRKRYTVIGHFMSVNSSKQRSRQACAVQYRQHSKHTLSKTPLTERRSRWMCGGFRHPVAPREHLTCVKRDREKSALIGIFRRSTLATLQTYSVNVPIVHAATSSICTIGHQNTREHWGG